LLNIVNHGLELFSLFSGHAADAQIFIHINNFNSVLRGIDANLSLLVFWRFRLHFRGHADINSPFEMEAPDFFLSIGAPGGFIC
jgi:hypothetical protein